MVMARASFLLSDRSLLWPFVASLLLHTLLLWPVAPPHQAWHGRSLAGRLRSAATPVPLASPPMRASPVISSTNVPDRGGADTARHAARGQKSAAPGEPRPVRGDPASGGPDAD